MKLVSPQLGGRVALNQEFVKKIPMASVTGALLNHVRYSNQQATIHVGFNLNMYLRVVSLWDKIGDCERKIKCQISSRCIYCMIIYTYSMSLFQ